MVAQAVEWVHEQDKIAQRRPVPVDTKGQSAVTSEAWQSKLGPAKGIIVGSIMGALCWSFIILAIILG
jgi:hypothetical protein